MHRRDFLKVSTAATALAVAGGEAAADALPLGAPAIITAPTLELVLALPWPLALASVAETPQRLARGLGSASDGRLRITIEHRGEPGIELIATGQADLYFGSETSNAGLHPAYELFAASHGSPAAHASWLAKGGGQQLWDQLSAGYNVKPLLAGHTVVAPGLWMRDAIASDATRLDRVRLAADGLPAAIAQRCGAITTETPATDLVAAFRDGRIDAAEWAGPFASLAIGIDAGARVYYRQGILAQGRALALGIRRSLWDRFADSERRIIEACATREFNRCVREAAVNNSRSLDVLSAVRGVEFRQLPTDVAEALAGATRDVLADLASHSPDASAIIQSRADFSRIAGGSQVADAKQC